MAEQVELEVLRRIAVVSTRINAGQRLEDTLQAVAEGVVHALGFGVAALNYCLPEGDLQVVAVAGHTGARDSLLGMHTPRQVMDDLIAQCEPWGGLRYLPHGTPSAAPTWSPDVPDVVEPGAWHRDDVLIAPLQSAGGDLVGVLSVDLPPGGQRPGPALCELLGMFAVQAGIAIDNSRLTDQLIDERERLDREQARLRASEAAFRFSFNSSAGAMATLGLRGPTLGRVLQANEAFCRVLGVSREELLDNDWKAWVSGAHRRDAERMLDKLVQGTVSEVRSEIQVLRTDGVEAWVGLTATVIDGGSLQDPFLLMDIVDVTERRSREHLLRYQANHDQLTGLANRRILVAHLQGVVARARWSGRPGAVLYCDLDNFKQINDRYGHGAGDIALRETASRLQAQVRSEDLVARLGGDEFVVVAEHLERLAAVQLADRIRAAVAEPLRTVPGTLRVSVGLAVIDPSATDSEHLLHRADQAMYADKHTRRGASPPVRRGAMTGESPV